MKFPSASLLLLLLVISLCPVHGVLEANYTNLKCKCVQETSKYYPARHISRIQFLPAGNGCPKVEIIVWLKTKSIVCLNPHARWIQKFLKMLLKESASSTPSAPMLGKRIP
ncbi:C-X-C motif chemokine 13 [Dasypus novemcinctus]|uniref:C-X-C motif chemokine 13 n=1 Tax=Dasypus novemcinctus TaxID=9361 RepID=UPI000328F031|nr:C-X-C motif chemokine 13 [Dasypus novemcinctus]